MVIYTYIYHWKIHLDKILYYYKMEVFYNNKKIINGEFLKPSETQIQPIIKYPYNNTTLYTIIMYDSDAYDIKFSGSIRRVTHIHLLLTNIKNNNINSGTIILSYEGPHPPVNTGKHRYIIEVYEQSHKIDKLPINNRVVKSIKQITLGLKLNKPLYKLKFISKFENKSIFFKCANQKQKTIKTKFNTKTKTKRNL